jgi:phosphohistidine phosphatase
LARKLAGNAAGPEQTRLADGYPTATLTEFLIATPWRELGAKHATLQRFVAAKDLV